MKADETFSQDMVLESVVCIEDVKFTFIYDTGFIVADNIPNKLYRPTIILHRHSHYEIFFTYYTSIFTCEDGTSCIPPNKILVVPPGTYHAFKYIFPNEESKKNTTINFKAEKTNCRTTVPLYNILSKTFKPPFTIIDADCETLKLFEIFDSDLTSSDVLKNATLSFKFHELLLFLIKNAYENEIIPHSLNNSDSNMSRAYKINMIINRCFADNITANSVAAHLKISTRQLSRIMYSNFGCSFKELLTYARMSQAIHLLRTTNKTFSQISIEVGYNSTKVFYRAFKKYCGCLPSEFKADASKVLPPLEKIHKSLI
ncbi:MAG: helix-turn-helix transcriptional regulator [Clostridia bacterium]|nr:helix-turn-helix transcriptional regulator [Clostridia bacterium]